jgi:tetratricopeptide (TPR) repeat protein
VLDREGALDHQDFEVKDRADRALRNGNAAEALPLYVSLLRNVTVLEAGLYEGWLEGVVSALTTLGRQREAGYVLMSLRRFADAERCFAPEREPQEWALCAINQGRPREASRVLAAAGYTALAAIAVEASGDWGAAKLLWERVLVEDRLRGRPYETALVHFNLGQALRRLGDVDGARQQLAITQTKLEELADGFEARGERDRAFDCYQVLIRLGKETGTFENVAEGYLNAIRVTTEADYRAETVLEYYEDFLEFAASSNEWHAAALMAQDAADFSLRLGLTYERHYRQRAASLWNEAARHNLVAGGPPEVSENALLAAIDAAASAGDLPVVGRLYAALAELALPAARLERYAALARRYRSGNESLPAGQPFPEHFRRRDAYVDVWRHDLVEWELAGRPLPVLVQLLSDRIGLIQYDRQVVRALLLVADERFSAADPAAMAELALALGRVQNYSVLRPLEQLAAHPSPRVRTAAMTATAKVFHERSVAILRHGLGDDDEGVRAEARRALRTVNFRNSLQPLVRLFRESRDEAVRLTVIDAIAENKRRDAGLFLLEVVRGETGPVFDLATRRLRSFPNADFLALVRQLAEGERSPVKEALESILAGPQAEV